MSDVYIRRGNTLDIEISDGCIGVFQLRGGHTEELYIQDTEDAEMLLNTLQSYIGKEYARDAANPPKDYEVDGC